MVQTPPDAKVIGDLRRQIRAADNEGDFAEQVRLLRTLCDLEVNDLRSRQRLGHLLRDLGHREEAVLVLQQCASGYAMEGFLNRSIQIVKTLIELNPGDQVALRALQGLYSRRRSQRPSAGPIPGFQPAPFGADDAPEEVEDRRRELTAETTDPSLTLPPRIALMQARKTSEREPLEPERDLGELLASSMDVEVSGEQSPEHPQSISLPLFGSLPERVQRKILATMKQHEFNAGDLLFQQGQSDPRLWLLRSGRVEVRRRVGRDEEQVLARLGRGAVLGEMSIFDDSPRSASAVALGEARAYSMDRKTLAGIWTDYPVVHKSLLKNYRLRHLRNLVAHAPFMQQIPEAHRRGVAMLFRVREVPAGSVLISPDEEVSGIFGVLGGRVRVEARAPSGELRQMAILGPGSLFGYGQSLFDHPEPFRCVTNGRASILRMNEDTMNGLLEAHPPLADYLRATMSRRIDLAAAIVEAQNEFHG